MRKLILQMQASVDGFVASDAPQDWLLWNWGETNRWDAELKRDFNEVFATVDTILLSRKMVEEGYLGHWAGVAEAHPDDPYYAFARRVGKIDKVALSNRLQTSRWPRTQVRGGDLIKEVGALKTSAGGAIISFGGIRFASALLGSDLIDEIQLYTNPVALGSGDGLFALSGFRQLTLLGSKAYGCGMVVSRYAPGPRR